MTPSSTERLNPMAEGLDALPGDEILRRLLTAQEAALSSVRQALPAIETGAEAMAAAIRGGGRLVYAGAGSSALMANADGMELPGTYGIAPERILLLMAGGLPQDAHMPGDTEDDRDEAARAAEAVRAGDTVIAVTASGRTPYPVTVARIARARGARVVAIANTPEAGIFDHADVAICLPTPPELIAGSTRMGAGTAQKAALNMLSTLMAIRLGAVHDGMMVGLVADNDKLRGRAAAMVARIAGVGEDAARASLDAAGGAVRPAVLVAHGLTPGAARALLEEAGGHLRAALAAMTDEAIESVNQGRDR